MLARLASLLAFIALTAAALAAPAQACAALLGESAVQATHHAPAMTRSHEHHHAGHKEDAAPPASGHHGETPCPHGDCEPVAEACIERTLHTAPPAEPVPDALTARVDADWNEPASDAALPRAPPPDPVPALSPVDLFIKQLI